MSREVKVKGRKDVPLLIAGKATLIDADGNMTETTDIALCRCGQSANKQFCDGSQRKVAFEASEFVIVLSMAEN